MKIMMICKYPPIQGGVSADAFWTAQLFVEMGHEVQVVTNALEVEESYRVEMSAEDSALLTGFEVKDSVVVHSTFQDKKHLHIPQNNPVISKLVGIGLSVVKKFNPDLIWAYYLEPYGVAALLISKITNVPFSIRHAGSDLGRLMQTEQLQSLYYEVFRNAAAILSRSIHFDYFESIGVSKSRMFQAVSPRLPSKLFFPTEFYKNREKFVIGVYGKVGSAKGTVELLRALAILKSREFPCVLKAHWGGRDMNRVLKEVGDLSIEDIVEVKGFIPHWKIPNFIHECDTIVFLENGFGIAFHGPAIPLESLSCGRPVIVTKEIKMKPSFGGVLFENKNCLVVPSPINPESLAEAIIKMRGKIDGGDFSNQQWFDSKQRDVVVKKEMESLLKAISINTL
jgi:glycosyltransferase involved in cell wall biosynthesis